jgi:hypothetical protein
MSEIIPPTDPDDKQPVPFLNRNDDPNPSPGPGAVTSALIGFALLVVSIISCFGHLFFALIGLSAAIASLFFKGYRYIFVGFLLTLLIGTGLIMLALIVICGNGHTQM